MNTFDKADNPTGFNHRHLRRWLYHAGTKCLVLTLVLLKCTFIINLY